MSEFLKKLNEPFTDEDLLYHYTSSSIALEYILNDATLRFNPLSSTNDPLELLEPIQLMKADYAAVYDLCDTLPISIGTGTGDPISTGKLSFKKSSLSKYGNDFWRDVPANAVINTVKKINYISLSTEIGDSTAVNINVNLSGYAKIYAKFKTTSNLAFDKSGKKTIDLAQGDNEVKIFTTSAIHESSTELYVEAYNDPSNIIKLAGDFAISPEDRLIVIAYDIIKEEDLYVYKINNATLPISTNEFDVDFNNIVKQAVIKIDEPTINDKTFSNWDFNSNGALDVFTSTVGLSVDMDEYNSFLTDFDINTTLDGECIEDITPKIMVLPGTINTNWLLTEIATPATNRVITLNSVDDIEIGDVLKLKKFDGTGNTENVVVSEIYETILSVVIDTDIVNSYSSGDVLCRENSLGGISKRNCVCVINNALIQTYVHEYLHMDDKGDLDHITEDITNIMSISTSASTNNLRYRELGTEVENESQQQWEAIHGK